MKRLPRAFPRATLVPGALTLVLVLALAAAVSAEDETPLEGEEDIEIIRVVGVESGTLSDNATGFGNLLDLERYAGEHKRLEDLLAQSVGVQIRRFGGEGERAEVSIRGFSSSQVLVELDGVALNGARGNGVDLSSIPLAQLEAVEVLR
ncbi:MAG: TonB-dependent receptor plug domain-containing protein, partial [bacterium]|nr:TonB-dependent receptor plug domain-containing protein [bacterium]